MTACLVCQNDVEPFISFGRMPIANGFLTAEQFPKEYFFELKVGFCPNCKVVQLLELVDETKMFHENYAFFSSTSVRMAQHFKEFAGDVMASYLGPDDPFVVEIGSNDGIMLQYFKEAGIRHLGIEPSANVADVARSKGINTISKFFNADVAGDVVAEYGQADAFLSANCMCHIPYLDSIAEGIALLLKPEGVLAFEDPYLGDIIAKTSYDQMYDEHVYYFSLTSVSSIFARAGLELVDAVPQDVHGGSMRYVLTRKGVRPVSAAVGELMEKERQLGLDTPETFDRYRRNVEKSRDELMALLKDLKAAGQRVVGYAATSKSTTVTNYCGITPDLVEYISDTTPIKQGKFSPGAHIPVRPHGDFEADYPPYALLFGWNHAKEIMAKEGAFRDAGGRWIVYVPEVKVL